MLIGHGVCHIICETSETLNPDDVRNAVQRIAGVVEVNYVEVPQDTHLPKTRLTRSAAAITASSRVYR